MCGFVGLIQKQKLNIEEMLFAHHNLQKLLHRGPDDQQIYYDSHAYLGFNRLSINDLEHGGQPFSNYQLDLHVLFNGEIYNYLTLKQELEQNGFVFQTNSEVEVILYLFYQDGISFIEKLRGMYAILIYDAKTNTVYLTRDSFGIKPLYFYYDQDHLFISSELKSFKHFIRDESDCDVKALQHYFTFQYIPEPYTSIKDVKTVTPGSVLQIKIGETPIETCFINNKLVPEMSTTIMKPNQIKDVIYESVAAHMLSDVEVGSFLSGGIDSTIVTSCAAKMNPNIKAYTIGFDVSGYSEINDAQKTADFLNIDLTTVTLTADDYLKQIKNVIHYLDSPVADPSVIPIYLIAKRASEDVKVILSGEGADELFGGYGIYREPNSLAIFHHMPIWIKELLLKLSRSIPEGVKGKHFIERGCVPLSKRYVGNAFVFNEAQKKSLLKCYNETTPFSVITAPLYKTVQTLDLVSQMQSIDLQTWLKGDILVKSDRLSMANSLELRVPFLDANVFQVAKSLTNSEKINGKTTKFLLREAFKDVVPPHIYTAKKRGYQVPLNQWFKNELYDFAKENIQCGATEHLINQNFALNLLNQHVNSNQNHSRKLWTIIIFNLWYEQWITKEFQ